MKLRWIRWLIAAGLIGPIALPWTVAFGQVQGDALVQNSTVEGAWHHSLDGDGPVVLAPMEPWSAPRTIEDLEEEIAAQDAG